MTTIAGFFSRKRQWPVPAAMCDEIKTLMSRDPQDKVFEFYDQNIYLAKIDIGAFEQPAVLRDADGNIAIMAGEPLVPGGNGRQDDLKRLLRGLLENDWQSAKTARGQYCAAFYSSQDKKLSLLTDRLGFREIYYAVTRDAVVFASAMRILEEFSGLKKNVDLIGVTELCAYGFPLGNRSRFAEIKSLLPAQVVEITETEIKASTYWDWPSSVESCDDRSLCERLYATFHDAIALRLKNDRSALAFLSGGLDSRCIVGALRARGVTVHSLNFAAAGTQDRVLGEMVAVELGALHQSLDLPAGLSSSEKISAAVSAWRNSEAVQKNPPERPSLVWSGDGGSVGLGHVYLSESIVTAAENRRWEELYKAFSAHNGWAVPHGKLLRHQFAAEVEAAVRRDFVRELQRLDGSRGDRAAHVFLIANDQRHHLATVYANSDLHRVEFLTPFCDVDFLAEIIAAPVRPFLRHKLYTEWLSFFPPAVSQVPWQAYPGHVAPPVPIPPNLDYQWSGRKRSISRNAKLKALRVLRHCLSDKFPSAVLSRPIVAAAAAVTACGMLDREYLLDMAIKFVEPWANSEQPSHELLAE